MTDTTLPIDFTEQESAAWRLFLSVHRKIYDYVEAELPLSIMDMEVLNLVRGEPLLMKRVSDGVGLSPSGLTRRVDSLVKRGFVERLPSAVDRRNVFLAITPLGVDTYAWATSAYVDAVRRAFTSRLDAHLIEALEAMLPDFC